MGQSELIVDQDACWEIVNLASGVFAPLKGFLNQKDYRSVVESMRLANGAPWTIPITLEVPEADGKQRILADTVTLKLESGEAIAELTVEDIYKVDFRRDLKQVFGTEDRKHPGVAKEAARSPWRVGGPLRLLDYVDSFFSEYSLTPAQTRNLFHERGWGTVTGFQTRNAIHRAHEHLQRIALELTDGLFIQPLIGWKKGDDMSPIAIVRSYEVMLREVYPAQSVVFGLLKTPMRYAGPREAVFHALIRRNFGCTHFIVGRDHAGVSDYYGKYEAQELCSQFDDLGIHILNLCGPYYCEKCCTVVTEKTCPHGDKYEFPISGTYLRAQFLSGQSPPSHLMRPEVTELLHQLAQEGKLFNSDV